MKKERLNAAAVSPDPRTEIRELIGQGDTQRLLCKAAQMHGHYCPGLAMGVRAAAYAMDALQVDSDGMEDLLAITETNNCFADGVQFVTGCSFGNNALIYKDVGKTAFTLARRDGQGLRICSRHESRAAINEAFPAFQEYYKRVVEEQNHDAELVAAFKRLGVERAFGTLQLPFDALFEVQETTVDIPPYAGIRESVCCHLCGESVMKNRTLEINGKHFCYNCGKIDHDRLDGNGIHTYR